MNRRIAEIPPSLIRSINAKKRPGDIDLGLGQPTLQPPLEAFSSAMEWTSRFGSPYSPNAGFGELREAIAAYLNQSTWGADVLDDENVCVTVGSEEALFLAIKSVIDPSQDEVLIVEPCYLAYPKICLLEGIRHRMVGLPAADRFEPRAAPVLAELRPDTRMIIINTPANPTGRIWPEAELKALAEGLAARGGQPRYILADEVYRELYFNDAPPPSIAHFHEHTLVAGSLSKSNALTGLRLGWLAGPRNVVAAATTVQQFVNTSASTFSQRVAVWFFSDTDRLAAHRPLYSRSREALLEAARDSELDLIPPAGTFYAFVKLPPSTGQDSLRAAEDLLERQRVVAVPGAAFGSSSEGWLRISWVVPDDTVTEGIRRISAWSESIR